MMTPVKNIMLIILLPLLLASNMVIGSGLNEKNPLDKKKKTEIVKKINSLIMKNYIDLEKAEKMKALLSKNLKEGKYKEINDPASFATQLTRDLHSIYPDKHVGVRYAGAKGPKRKMMNPMEMAKKDNFQFKELKTLEGNVGYLRFDMFAGSEKALEVANAAMAFLENTDAVIFDLRFNRGGSGEMVKLMLSYFVEKSVKFKEAYFRNTDERIETWTLDKVPGNKLLNKPVYVLTSKGTGSAAEALAFHMKSMDVATLVGGTTAGAGNYVNFLPVVEGFNIALSVGKVTNTVSNAGWEGIGVTPDIKTEASNALLLAHTKALEAIKTKKSSAKDYDLIIENIKGSNDIEVSMKNSFLKKYVGTYGIRTVSLSGGSLFLQREGSPHILQLTPTGKNKFSIDLMSKKISVLFEEENGEITKMNLEKPTGAMETIVKS